MIFSKVLRAVFYWKFLKYSFGNVLRVVPEHTETKMQISQTPHFEFHVHHHANVQKAKMGRCEPENIKMKRLITCVRMGKTVIN